MEFLKELHCKIFDLIIKMEFFYKLIESPAVILIRIPFKYEFGSYY